MTKRWHISRRTVLRGLGTSLALPWLEAMSLADDTKRRPLRMVFLYHPLGAETSAWKGVTGSGKSMKLTPTLEPLEPVKEQLLILDGLNGRPHPKSGHNRSACLWLSSASAGQADTWSVETDVTLDRMLAPKLSRGARQPSLELSCTSVGQLMHAMNLSWRGPGTPVAAETSPREVFGRMFGAPREDMRRKSILDVIGDDARTLKAKLGNADQHRLDEYLESVRSLERQIATFERGTDDRPKPPIPRPGEPESLGQHIRLMLDLSIVALQQDHTRVITCALGDESEGIQGTTYNRTLTEFGIDKSRVEGKVKAEHLDWGHHKCTHNPKPTLPIIQAIDRWYVEQLSYFLQKLHATRDGDATLLDNSIVVYGCTNGGGGEKGGWPGHGLRDVACLLAGRGGGLLPKPGRVLPFYGTDQRSYKRGVSLSNLWLTLAQLAGLDHTSFGRSSGTLSGLE